MQAQGKWLGSCRAEVLIDECGRVLWGGQGSVGTGKGGTQIG